MRAETEMKRWPGLAAVDLAGLPKGELRRMARAGAEILRVQELLRRKAGNVVAEILQAGGTFYEWDHYPPGDVYDPTSRAQYYYHAHPLGQRFQGEHGHFHTFIGAEGLPPVVRSEPPESDDGLSHLVAISVDSVGRPFRLFTVNRWVTGETWREAVDVCVLLEAFTVDRGRPALSSNRWVTAMIALFKPQIRALLLERDRRVEAWQARWPEGEVLEDRDLEVVSFQDICVEAQLSRVWAQLRL